MNRRILRAKIHRVLITDSRLDYDGSLGIAEELMNAADIVAGEEVLVRISPLEHGSSPMQSLLFREAALY